jgi:hypothetical protein
VELGSERVCVPVSWHHTIEWTEWSKSFELKILCEGPWRGILASKQAGKYQPLRFTVTGSLKVELGTTPLVCPLGLWLDLYYVGRGGSELKIGWWDLSGGDLLSGRAEYTVGIDRSLDVSTEWRGPGLQGFRLTGSVPYPNPFCGYEVDVSGEICMTLTWVD